MIKYLKDTKTSSQFFFNPPAVGRVKLLGDLTLVIWIFKSQVK